MKQLLKVSVSMITYNHEKFIEEAINGVLMQECDFEIELILANDCSSDKTDEVIQNILRTHPRASIIKYINHEKNIGMIPNFIFTLQQCKGKYIALCEGDDYWTDPLKLQKQVDFMEANPDYVLTHHDAKIVNEKDDLIKESKLPKENRRDFMAIELQKGPLLLTMSLCFRNVIKVFPTEFYQVTNGDTFLISLLGAFGKGKFQENITPASYRIHLGGFWSNLKGRDDIRLSHKMNTFLIFSGYYKRINDSSLQEFFYKKYVLTILGLVGFYILKKDYNKAKYYSQLFLEKSTDPFKFYYLFRTILKNILKGIR